MMQKKPTKRQIRALLGKVKTAMREKPEAYDQGLYGPNCGCIAWYINLVSGGGCDFSTAGESIGLAPSDTWSLSASWLLNASWGDGSRKNRHRLALARRYNRAKTAHGRVAAGCAAIDLWMKEQGI